MAKFIKDPIYGVIEISNDFHFINDLIKTKEVQRLKNIYQLGECFKVFFSATHSRFCHALGVFRNAQKIIENLNEKISYDDQKVILSAALLHDIGHGPRSHCFEEWTGHNHEQMTSKIICDSNSEVNKILIKNQINPNEVMKIINHDAKYKYYYQIVSSQIDADRLDYLLRDSYFTGANYGNIDINILFKWMQVKNNQIVFNIKATGLIEQILFSRAQMFKQVYINNKVLCYQSLIDLMFKRYKILVNQNFKFKDQYNLYYLLDFYCNNTQLSLSTFLEFDDNKFNLIIESWSKENDDELKELANNYLYNNQYYCSNDKQEGYLKEMTYNFTFYNPNQEILMNTKNGLIDIENFKDYPSLITKKNKFIFKSYLYKKS